MTAPWCPSRRSSFRLCRRCRGARGRWLGRLGLGPGFPVSRGRGRSDAWGSLKRRRRARSSLGSQSSKRHLKAGTSLPLESLLEGGSFWEPLFFWGGLADQWGFPGRVDVFRIPSEKRFDATHRWRRRAEAPLRKLPHRSCWWSRWRLPWLWRGGLLGLWIEFVSFLTATWRTPFGQRFYK